MIRQWTLLRSRPLQLQRPRLHPLKLSAHSFASAARDDSVPSGIRATTPVDHKENDTPRKRPPSHYFHLLPAAMKSFHAAAGHFIVPYSLVIPRADQVVVDGYVVDAAAPLVVVKGPGTHQDGIVYGLVTDVSQIKWPEEVHGFSFGRCLNTFASNPKHWSKHRQVVQDLRDMGFPLDPINRIDDQWKRFKWGQQIFAALQTYYSIRGDTLVPQEFVVPRNDPKWPQTTWGLPLGERVSYLRKQTWLPEWKLTDMWSVDFSFDVSETLWATQIMPSLQVFHQVYRHCDVDQQFVVPSEAPWPKGLWGKNLGVIVQGIRIGKGYVEQANHYEEHLDAIGFVRCWIEHRWSNVILPALQTFAAVHKSGHVPRDFVVPATAPWPEATHGLQLGVAAHSIRNHEAYAPQVARDAGFLDAIGFVWGWREHRWGSRILPALQIHYQMHGDSRVPREFIVPSEAPWPVQTWGLPLGVVVNNIKSKNYYAAERLQDRDALEAIEFGM